MDLFWAGPPVTRTLAAAIVVESLLATAKVISVKQLYFSSSLIFKSVPEVWRFATSFCFTSGYGILMDPYMVWQYAGGLESESLRFSSRPGSFLIYLLFIATTVLFYSIIPMLFNTDTPRHICPSSIFLAVTVPVVEGDCPCILHRSVIRKSIKGLVFGVSMLLVHNIFGYPFFMRPLLIALAYTYAQENRNRTVQFVIIPINVKYLPFVMLVATFVQAGPGATVVEAMGIPAAHLYDFLTRWWPEFGGGRDILKTPRFVENWFGGGSRGTRTQHGNAFRPASATSTGVSNSWVSRGSGRRLGGD